MGTTKQPLLPETLTAERRDELKVVLRKMDDTATAFYGAARAIGNHPFLEFCGLMTEYVKMCEVALQKGIDFTQASVHTGFHVPMESFHVAYAREKLECIYGPQIMNEGPGSPTARFGRLMAALEARVPNDQPYRSDRLPEDAYLAAIDRLIELDQQHAEDEAGPSF